MIRTHGGPIARCGVHRHEHPVTRVAQRLTAHQQSRQAHRLIVIAAIRQQRHEARHGGHVLVSESFPSIDEPLVVAAVEEIAGKQSTARPSASDAGVSAAAGGGGQGRTEHLDVDLDSSTRHPLHRLGGDRQEALQLWGARRSVWRALRRFVLAWASVESGQKRNAATGAPAAPSRWSTR